ncbi:MAG: hypothetical protein HFH53_01030 [Hespellia sp.]|jgi:cobalt-precorrin 5A hydrolase|nr:hypothetical protein [Hespellia sp.]
MEHQTLNGFDKHSFENAICKDLVIYSFTDAGSRANTDLCRMMGTLGYSCRGYCVARFAGACGLQPLPSDWKEQIGKFWGVRALLFIGASGIAVRAIAPFVKDKFTDSPVLVMDERRKFVVPLLSGHVGGAVELAHAVAACTGAVPVITTATDVQEKFAVDVFARKNRLIFEDRDLAKRISAGILEGKKVGMFSVLPPHGEIPENVELCENCEELTRYETSIVIDEKFWSGEMRSAQWLHMMPQDICVGIGCRKNIPAELLWAELGEVLQDCKISWKRLYMLASIELKKEEPGILALQKRLHVPVRFYSAEQLKEIESVSSSSTFVEQVTGVDNVCERAARAACPNGIVIQPKICKDQCTFALVQERKREIAF